jgi:hypothetical protein
MLKIGDVVTIVDRSYAVRVDHHEKETHIGLNHNKFKVIGKRSEDHLQSKHGSKVHDIFIQDTVTEKCFLHSEAFVEKVLQQKVKSREQIYLTLIEDGYVCNSEGYWCKKGELSFAFGMFSCCGMAPSGQYPWKAEWLEEE